MIYVRTGLSGETSRDGYLREYKDEEDGKEKGEGGSTGERASKKIH